MVKASLQYSWFFLHLLTCLCSKQHFKANVYQLYLFKWATFHKKFVKITDQTILEFCRARRICRPGSSGSTVNWQNFSNIRVINKQSSQIFTKLIKNVHHWHFLWHFVSNSTRDILFLSADAEPRIYNKICERKVSAKFLPVFKFLSIKTQ